MAGLGLHIGIQRFSRVNHKPPMAQLNLFNQGLSSAEIDDRLEYYVAAGTNHTEINLQGNENPTAASAAAIQTLHDNYVFIIFNKGYTP